MSELKLPQLQVQARKLVVELPVPFIVRLHPSTMHSVATFFVPSEESALYFLYPNFEIAELNLKNISIAEKPRVEQTKNKILI